MALSRRSSSAWSPVGSVRRRAAGAWAGASEVRRRTAGAWVSLWTSVAVALTNRTVDATNVGAGANAGFLLENTGIARTRNNGFYAQVSGQWMPSPSTAEAANYEVRVTLVSGTAPQTGVLNTWLALSTSREWVLSRATNGSNSCVLRFEIRRIGTTTVLAQADITLIATRESGA